MNKKYPILNDNFRLHLTAFDCTLFYIVKNNSSIVALKKWKIQPLMANYLLLCDGTLTHDEIVSRLNVPFSILVDNGAEYLQTETDVISFNDNMKYCKDKLTVTGSFNSYNPLHVSIEVTDYCNFRCKHCYINASPETLSYRSYDDMISLIDKLYDNGVNVIELTGGECTTHPQFKEILKYASEKFNLVAIISNGYLIGKDEELASFIGSLNNVTVQISLDGMKDYHDKFRNKEGAFDNAVKSIKYLKKYNVFLAVACNFTYDNLNDIEDLFKLCKKLNVDSFGISPVSAFGRGTCYSCSNGNKDLYSEAENILKDYQDDELFKSNKLAIERYLKNREINCGAGWRSFSINGASGNVRICLLSTDIGVIGNIDTDNYNDIFSKEKLDAFRFAHSPSPFSEPCCNCEYKERCSGCIIKALDIYKNHYPECPWVKKYHIQIN